MSKPGHVAYSIACGAVSFLASIALFGALSAVNFDFFVFEDLSLDAIAAPWRSIVKYAAAASFGLSATLAYLFVEKQFHPSTAIRLPLTLVFGVAGFALLIAILGVAIALLATALLLFGLFFGPGDR